jgi:hypothetical protein
MFCSSQDCRQRLIVGIECIIELYRVVVGTCLIWFIPHSCDLDSTSGYGSISELKQAQACGWFPEGVHSYAIILNLITLGSFLALYGIEVYRENALISYLEVTPLLGTDNESVGEIVAKLDPKKRKKLYYIDTVYFGFGGFCMCAFGANSIFSGIVLLHNVDNKTVTTFITDILFMMTKLYRIHYVINTEKNIFYSAYMTNFVQFNDLDPTERTFIEKQDVDLESGDVVWEEDWISCKTREEIENINTIDIIV